MTTIQTVAALIDFVQARLDQGDETAAEYHHDTCDSLTPGHHLACDCDGPADLRALRDSVRHSLAKIDRAYRAALADSLADCDGESQSYEILTELGLAVEALAEPYRNHPDYPQE